MDKDRIAGSAKDVAGKVEGAAGDIAGDARIQASGRAREAAGKMQNLYGQATNDAARDASDAAVSYAKDAYQNSGDTFRDGSQAVAKKVQDKPLGSLLMARPGMTIEDHRAKMPGTDADRPTLPGGRGTLGARGGGGLRGALPKLKNSRNDGVLD